MTPLEDLLDDLRHLEENFFAPAAKVTVPLDKEQLSALINALDAIFAVKRAVSHIE